MGTILSPVLRLSMPGWYQHYCPGCKQLHEINTGEVNHSGAKWGWDGNVHQPSFSPSVHIKAGPWEDEDGHHPQFTVCHYTLTAGVLHYCSDTPHAFGGQSVPLPPLPERYQLQWQTQLDN